MVTAAKSDRDDAEVVRFGDLQQQAEKAPLDSRRNFSPDSEARGAAAGKQTSRTATAASRCHHAESSLSGQPADSHLCSSSLAAAQAADREKWWAWFKGAKGLPSSKNKHAILIHSPAFRCSGVPVFLICAHALQEGMRYAQGTPISRPWQ